MTYCHIASVPGDLGEIRFYRCSGPHGFLSNFYPSPIVLDGSRWPTVEHWYQAQKGIEADGTLLWDIRELLDLRSPAEAKRYGRARPRRDDWHGARVPLMLLALYAKFTQHRDLLDRLLATAPYELIEDSPRDYLWGCGQDGSGRNLLGEKLMEVRKNLAALRP